MTSSTYIINWIEELKYLGIFLGAFIEGPATGLIAGFLSKTQILNPYYAYLSHAIGDFSADFVYYLIGYYGITKSNHLQKINTLFGKNPIKTIFLGKLTHAFGLPVLIGMGATKYPINKFLLYNFLATIIKSAIILAIGYLLGSGWESANNIFSYMGIIGIGIIIVIAIYLFTRKNINKNSNEKT